MGPFSFHYLDHISNNILVGERLREDNWYTCNEPKRKLGIDAQCSMFLIILRFQTYAKKQWSEGQLGSSPSTELLYGLKSYLQIIQIILYILALNTHWMRDTYVDLNFKFIFVLHKST